MLYTTADLLLVYNPVSAYTESEYVNNAEKKSYSIMIFLSDLISEISLIFPPTSSNNLLFNGKVMKTNTVLASYAAGTKKIIQSS